MSKCLALLFIFIDVHFSFLSFGDVAYSHLDFSSKQESAKTIAGLLDFSGEQEEPEMTVEEIEQEIKRLKQLLAKKKK